MTSPSSNIFDETIQIDVSSVAFLTPAKDIELATTTRDSSTHSNSPLGSEFFITNTSNHETLSPTFYDASRMEPTVFTFNHENLRTSLSSYKSVENEHDDDDEEKLVLSTLGKSPLFQTPDQEEPSNSKLLYKTANPYLEITSLLWKGLILEKIPFHSVGGTKRRLVRIQAAGEISNHDATHRIQVQLNTHHYAMDESEFPYFAPLPLCLELLDPKGRGKSSKPIYISDVCDIQMGCQTPAFQAFMIRNGQDSIPHPSQCFSILGPNRSFDFYTETPYEAISFVFAFQQLMLQVHHSPIQSSYNNNKLQAMILEQERVMEDAVFTSVRQGDIEQFQWFMEQGFSANHLERVGHRDSPLMAACRFGKSDILQIALQYNAKNDPHPEFGQTALQVAVSSGHEDCVRLLLDTAEVSGSDAVIVNHEDASKEAPIHVASRCGSLSILKLLLFHGANFCVVDARGNTCLHVAVLGGHVSCVRCILDVSGQTLLDERNDDGLSSIHIAAQMNRIECIRILVDNGADIHARTFQGETALDIARKRKFQKITHELEKVLRGFNDVRTWSRDDLFYYEHGHDPLFEGLSLHRIDEREPTRIKSRVRYAGNILQRENMNKYSTPPDGEITSTVDAAKPRSQVRSHGGGNDPLSFYRDQISSYPVETFYHDGVLWFAYFDHTNYHLYYVRVKDNHSQWEDPRNEGDGIADNNQTERHFPLHHYSTAPENNETLNETLDEHHTNHFQPETLVYMNSSRVTRDSRSVIQSSLSINSDASKKKRVHDTNVILQKIHKRSISEDDQSLSCEEDTSKRDNKNGLVVLDTCIQVQPSRAPTILLEDLLLKNKNASDLGIAQTVAVSVKTGGDTIHAGVAESISHPKIEPRSSNDRKPESAQACCVAPINADEEKYSKMLNMGVPLEAVLHKMSADGVEKETVNRFKVEYRKDVGPAAVESQASCPDLSVDETISKYITMVKVGIPIVAVEMKMKQEQVPDDKVLLWKKAVGQGTRRDETVHSATKSPIPLLSPPRRPSTAPVNRVANLQKIYWNTVSESKLNDSLWASDEVSGDDNVDVDEIKELENLFASKPNALKGRMKNRDEGSHKVKVKNVRLIELKRANNVAIALAQFRSFDTFDELCKAVTSQDRKKLNVEKLLNMKSLLPTTDELETMKQYHGGVESLGRAELFFLAVSRVPRFAQKLDTFIFISQFSDQVREFEQTSSFLEQACSEIMCSKKLKSILRKLLAVGNAVNERSGTPKAVGITVDSLLKTANKKGIDGKTTVLDHVIASIMKQDLSTNSIVKQGDNAANISSMSFRDDMPSICSASKIDVSDLENLMRDLKAGVEKTKLALAAEETTEVKQSDHRHPNHLFVNQSREFLAFAEERLSLCRRSMDKLDENITSVCRFFAEEPKWSHVNTIFSTLIDFAKLVDQSIEKWVRQEKADRRKALLHTPIKTTRESVKPITPAKAPRIESLVSNDKNKSAHNMDMGLSAKVAVIRRSMSGDKFRDDAQDEDE